MKTNTKILRYFLFHSSFKALYNGANSLDGALAAIPVDAASPSVLRVSVNLWKLQSKHHWLSKEGSPGNHFSKHCFLLALDAHKQFLKHCLLQQTRPNLRHPSNRHFRPRRGNDRRWLDLWEWVLIVLENISHGAIMIVGIINKNNNYAFPMELIILICQMLKGSKEMSFISQIFDENIRRLLQGKSFSAKNAIKLKKNDFTLINSILSFFILF